MKTKVSLVLLAALFFASFLCVTQGCNQKTPTVAAVQVIPPCQSWLLDSFETLTTHKAGNGSTFYVADNGVTLNDTDLTDPGVTFTSTLSLSTLGATNGPHSLDINIINPVAYNQNMFQLFGFKPNVWNHVKQFSLDVTVDPSVVAGASYGSVLIIAYAESVGKYYRHNEKACQE